MQNRHPNRGWRKRLEASVEAWLQSDEARDILKKDRDPREKLVDIMRETYKTAFGAGRESVWMSLREMQQRQRTRTDEENVAAKTQTISRDYGVQLTPEELADAAAVRSRNRRAG